MIEFLRGELQLKNSHDIVVQVGGLGYRVFIPTSLSTRLPAIGEEVTIFTYLHVRENELSLYGFLAGEEREVFTTLLQVSGVGPKLALAILAHLPIAELAQALVLGDTQTLTTIPGVGKKTAGRLILELKDKIKKLGLPEKMPVGTGSPVVRDEVIAALLALGYSLSEAQRAVSFPEKGKDDTVEELMRLALKKLAKY